jgi:hypothetical protein
MNNVVFIVPLYILIVSAFACIKYDRRLFFTAGCFVMAYASRQSTAQVNVFPHS